MCIQVEKIPRKSLRGIDFMLKRFNAIRESILRSKNDIAYKIGAVIHIHLRLLTLNHWNLFVLYVKCVFISLRRTLDTKQQSLNGNKTHKYGRSLISRFFYFSSSSASSSSVLIFWVPYAFAHSAILLRLNDSSIYSNILCRAKHKECSLCNMYIVCCEWHSKILYSEMKRNIYSVALQSNVIH